MNANEVISKLSVMVSQHVRRNSSSYSPLCSSGRLPKLARRVKRVVQTAESFGRPGDLKITLYSDDLLIQE